jgi:hypothetical protein
LLTEVKNNIQVLEPIFAIKFKSRLSQLMFIRNNLIVGITTIYSKASRNSDGEQIPLCPRHRLVDVRASSKDLRENLSGSLIVPSDAQTRRLVHETRTGAPAQGLACADNCPAIQVANSGLTSSTAGDLGSRVKKLEAPD